MKNSDLPAMPQLRKNPWKELNVDGGLTKREYFAGLAMQGILSADDCNNVTVEIARGAVMMADALLAELERTK